MSECSWEGAEAVRTGWLSALTALCLFLSCQAQSLLETMKSSL